MDLFFFLIVHYISSGNTIIFNEIYSKLWYNKIYLFLSKQYLK